MKRLELIACEAVQADLVEGLEKAIPEIEYTLVQRVGGRGLRARKEGSQVWPELNFMLVAYLGDEKLGTARSVIAEVSRRFPKEGIFAALSEAEMLR